MSDNNLICNTPDVVVSGLINAPLDQVWATVGKFNAFPTILPQIWDNSTLEGCGVGAIRTLSNNAGADIVEQLESIDGEGSVRSVSFSILGGSFADILPVDFKTYDALIQLQDNGCGETVFTWSASYDVKAGATEEEAKTLLQGIFNSALDGLRTIHEPQAIDCAAPDINLFPIENPDANVSVIINAPAEAVWATIGNFDALPHYLPALWNNSDVAGSGVGSVRTLTNAEGSKVVEELVDYDGVGDVRSLKFSILESENFPLPFDTDSYLAFMQVEKLDDNHSQFTWSASYAPTIAPNEAKAALEGLFNVAVSNLKLIHEPPDPCTGDGQGCCIEACNFDVQSDSDVTSSDVALVTNSPAMNTHHTHLEDGWRLIDSSPICGGSHHEATSLCAPLNLAPQLLKTGHLGCNQHPILSTSLLS